MSGHLISRPAYTEPCTTCRRHILIAVDSGLTIWADPITLNIPAEIAARLSGRSVYDICQTLGGKTYLVSRDIFRVAARREFPVVGDHVCIPGCQPGNSWHPPPARGHQPRPAIADTSEIPF